MIKIFLAADHAGFELKNHLVGYLKHHYEIVDLGTHNTESVDYPDVANTIALAMKSDADAFGILICGSGIGVSMAANRHSHIRAALVGEVLSAELSRQHNDANVLCLGSRLIGVTQAERCVDAFLKTSFDGGSRHEQRVSKLSRV